MKKFLINIAIFFVIVGVVDFSLGVLSHYMQAHAGGRTGAEYYVCTNATDEILIMGSSRASHHYVPEVITNDLGMSCYNAGQDGNGIVLHYGRWKMISQRYSPKLIIYDITADFDIITNDNMTYVDRLKPYCNDKCVLDYVSDMFPMEKIKLTSNMYRNNYKFIEMAFDCLRKGDMDNTRGYIPYYGRIRKEVINKGLPKKISEIDTDSVKMSCLAQFLKETTDAGTKVILVISPSWRGGNFTKEVFDKVQTLANEYGVKLLDYSSSEICDNPDFFEDSSHLNDKGARVFTKMFLSQYDGN